MRCLAFGVLFTLSACATPQLHSPEHLSTVALRCGLEPGDLVQEHDLKQVLIVTAIGPTPAQRACVYRWARKHHLHLTIIEAINRTPN